MAVQINTADCVGCGTCVDACPSEALVVNDDEVAEVNEDECTECGTCVDECPNEAMSL